MMIRNFLNRNKCNHVRNLLSEHIDGRTNPRVAALIEEHLAGCSECRLENESLQKTIDLMAQVKPVPVPHSFAITAVRPIPYPSFFRSLRIASVVLAAMLALVFTGDVTNILPGMFPNKAISSPLPAVTITSPSIPPGGDVVTKVSEKTVDNTGEVVPPRKVGEEGPAPQGVQEDVKLAGSSDMINETPSPAAANITEELWWLRSLEIILLSAAVAAGSITLFIWRRCKKVYS